MNKLKPYAKAVVAFVVTYIASLMSMVQLDPEVTPRTLLVALGAAIVTTYGVYQTPNRVK